MRRRPIKQNFIFASCFSRSHFSLATKIFETPWQNGCSYKKGSLGRDTPSVGTLVGLLLASTRQAASALLELSSSTLSSWCGLYQWPDWAPHRLGARALAPWACSWSLLGHEPNSATSSTLGSSKRMFLPSMIDVQKCAGLLLVDLGRLACGRTKPANLLPEGSCKLGSLSAFLSWKQQALSLSSFLLSLCRR